MLIVIEGADGCGKDTVASAIADHFKCRRMSFPNDAGRTGPMIRSYLRKEWSCSYGTHDDYLKRKGAATSALAFQALQLVNRLEFLPDLHRASSPDTRDSLVLARYWQSGWVYGGLDGIDPNLTNLMHSVLPIPDVNILLDVTAEECMSRRALRDGAIAPERYEGKRDFVKRVVTKYQELWRSAQIDHYAGKWVSINAMYPLAQVVEEAVQVCRDVAFG